MILKQLMYFKILIKFKLFIFFSFLMIPYRFFVDLYCTKDRRFLTINSNSKTTSEVWLVDCRHPLESPSLVQARTTGVLYHIEHRKDQLYILTTYGEPAEYKAILTDNYIDRINLDTYCTSYRNSKVGF